MIGTWLAGKLSGLIIFSIACLSVILVPVAIIQTVRINGISVFGWYAVNGYKPLYENLLSKDALLQQNEMTLGKAVDTCNASVIALKTDGDIITAAAQRLIDAAKEQQSEIATNLKALSAIKSTGEKCPTAEAILQAGFK